MAPTLNKPVLGNVLVIGGCGFLGHHIVKELSNKYDATVSVLDLRTTRNRREGVAYFDCDITNLDALLDIFGQVKPDVVIHTASPLGDAKVPKQILYKVNVEGTKSVIEASQKTGVKALVYTSSASVISDNVHDLVNADERWPVLRAPSQHDYYSETKAMAEEAVLAANRAPGTKLLTAAIRPAGIIGEGDVQLLPPMINVFMSGKTKFQVGDNTNLFDFTYVGNVVHGHLLAAIALLQTYKSSTVPLDHEKVDGEAFFITNESPIYFWDFARTVWKAAGNTQGTEGVWIISKDLGMPAGYIAEWFQWLTGMPLKLSRKAIGFSCMTRYYNINKAKLRLGYKPIVSLEEGVKRGVQSILEERRAEEAKKGQ